MIKPSDIDKLSNHKWSVTAVIQDVDKEIKHTHGWYPWEEAMLDYEVPLHTRNRVAEQYVKAGWKYVYHHTSSENLEQPGLTVFRLSTEPLDRKYIRRFHTVTAEGITPIQEDEDK